MKRPNPISTYCGAFLVCLVLCSFLLEQSLLGCSQEVWVEEVLDNAENKEDVPTEADVDELQENLLKHKTHFSKRRILSQQVAALAAYIHYIERCDTCIWINNLHTQERNYIQHTHQICPFYLRFHRLVLYS